MLENLERHEKVGADVQRVHVEKYRTELILQSNHNISPEEL